MFLKRKLTPRYSFLFPSFQLLIVPAIVGSALLHRLSDDCWEKITAWIYGMGLCALFIVSTVFHIVSWKKSHLRYPGRGTSCAYWRSWLSVFSIPRPLQFSQEGEEWTFSYRTGFERSLSSRHSLWVGHSFEDPTAVFASKEAALLLAFEGLQLKSQELISSSLSHTH